jgi:hypothetical protein
LATDRGVISVRFIAVVLLALAIGLLPVALAIGLLPAITLWPWSVFLIVGTNIHDKMLSIFWFLYDSRLSPIAHTSLAEALIASNFVIVGLAMALLYAFHLFGKMRALTGAVLASVVLFAFSGGNPQYFICPTMLLIYFLAIETPKRDFSDPRLITAAMSYFAVLNGFGVWYYLTNNGTTTAHYAILPNWVFSHQQVTALVGLPCFVTAIFLVWQIVRYEHLSLRSLLLRE